VESRLRHWHAGRTSSWQPPARTASHYVDEPTRVAWLSLDLNRHFVQVPDSWVLELGGNVNRNVTLGRAGRLKIQIPTLTASWHLFSGSMAV
jgi:hypothetical protein